MPREAFSAAGGDVAANIERELGAIGARLTGIDKRLDTGDRDIQALTKTTTDLTTAVAGLTLKIADLTNAQQAMRAHEGKIVDALERMVDRLAQPAPPPPAPGMSPGAVAAVAVPSAGGGGLLGAALWAKVAQFIGLS